VFLLWSFKLPNPHFSEIFQFDASLSRRKPGPYALTRAIHAVCPRTVFRCQAAMHTLVYFPVVLCVAGGLQDLDVFAAAEALAADKAVAADVLSVEAVSPVAFMAEASQLLKGAAQQAQQLQEAVTQAQVGRALGGALYLSRMPVGLYRLGSCLVALLLSWELWHTAFATTS
jgi:hypothetical protein